MYFFLYILYQISIYTKVLYKCYNYLFKLKSIFAYFYVFGDQGSENVCPFITFDLSIVLMDKYMLDFSVHKVGLYICYN